MRTICKKIVSTIVFTTLFIPQIGLAVDLYKKTMWTELALYSRSYRGIASGIGGLEVNFKSNLRLQPNNLSYKNGFLIANLNNRQTPIQVPITKNELSEVVYLVQQNNSRYVLQTSIDSTPVGATVYSSPALEETVYLKKLFKLADLEFASMIAEKLTPPKLRGVSPNTEALRLLDTDTNYRQLPQQWIKQPFSYPQIFMSFDPEMPKLVRMEFRPQVLFPSPSGYIVQVDTQTQTIGENPYVPLKQDFAQNPNVYLEAMPIVERATSITSALGFVAAACKQPKSCQHLVIESNNDEKAKLEKEYNNLEKRLVILTIVPGSLKKELDLYYKWSELSIRNFQPNQSPKAWGYAYDDVNQVIRHTINFGIKKATISSENLKPEAKSVLTFLAEQDLILAKQQLTLAKQQFLNYSIPENDTLLQAAAAVVFVSEGREPNLEKAQQSLNKAIELSGEYQGDRIEVTNMGSFVGKMMKERWSQPKGETIIKEMDKLRTEARLKAYDRVDSYLSECMTAILNCPSKKLQTLEVDLARTGLDRSLETGDIAWLWGRLSYLIGVQEPQWKANRLRLLLSYAKSAKTNTHRSELKRLAGILEGTN